MAAALLPRVVIDAPLEVTLTLPALLPEPPAPPRLTPTLAVAPADSPSWPLRVLPPLPPPPPTDWAKMP